MAALGAPVVPDVYSHRAGESGQVGYGSVSAWAPASTICRQVRTLTCRGRPVVSSPVRTACSTSGAPRTAARTVSANSAEPSTTRQRASATNVPSSGPVSIVEAGTATAPMWKAARMPVNSSTSSTMHSRTRSSGRTSRARSPAATRRTSADNCS